jgi:hypothetical protein
MADIVLKSEQIRGAPREVKEWIAALLAAELGLGAEPAAEPREPQHVALAECSAEEAGQLLELIRDDYVACQVLFELSRDAPGDRPGTAPVHRVAFADIMRHARLDHPDQLVQCLDHIARAFQEVRGDASVMLFALDRAGGVHVHETTRRSIRALWQVLVTSRLLDGANLPSMASGGDGAVPLGSRPAA